MSSVRFPVAVIVERKRVTSRWISERWDPVAVETDIAGSPATTAAECTDPAGSTWRFRGFAIELHRSEGEGYYLNVTSDAPKAFVQWRPAEEGAMPPVVPHAVSASYNEAARWLDGGESVEAVPLPGAIAEAVASFVAEHYRPEPRRKLRRNDPFANDDRSGEGERRR